MKVRSGLSLAVVLMLLGLVTITVFAQDIAVCDALINRVQQASAYACDSLDAGEICIGSVPVSLSAADMSEFVLGDVVPLEGVETVTTGAANPDEGSWGIALLKLHAGLADGALQMVLFGDATMRNAVQAAVDEPPTMLVKNVAGYAVNLREGPGRDANISGTMEKNAELTADGRSADGEWFRVQSDEGLAWVHYSLVRLDGDANALFVLDNAYTEPMQSFTLSTDGGDLCGAKTSGLLVHLAEQEKAQLLVDGVDLTLNEATLLLQAIPGEKLQIHVISGSVQVTAEKTAVLGEAGQSVQVALGGADALVPTGSPEVKSRYSFADVAGAPLALLPDEDPICVIGVMNDAESLPVTYGGPGAGYSALSSLESSSHYLATGYAADDDENPWWKLDTDRWVLQSEVRTAGLCSSVAKVDPPPLTTSSSPVSASNVSLVPAGQSVWQAESGPDVMTGTCSSAPIAICSHPAAIITNGDGTISWRGQEPIAYLLAPTGLNTYYFTGRNFQNNATIALNLTMTSESTWSLSFATVFDSDPTCTHTFYYTGTRKW